MNILAVDDEKLALGTLVSEIMKAVPDACISEFRNGKDALEAAKQVDFQVAFLDIQMRNINGISLAKSLKAVNPRINVIFTTGYSEYTGDAMALRASGYITKPVTAEKICEEIENLRYPIIGNGEPKLRIQAFGNFEVFANGVPLQFKYSKAKELLAYLVDRKGAMCSNGEIMAVLWENDDKGKISYFKSVRRDMLSVLKRCGCINAVTQQRGCIAIVPGEVRCDYFDWLSGTASGINAYRGEYMEQYSWSELTHGTLS